MGEVLLKFFLLFKPKARDSVNRENRCLTKV